MQIHRNLLKRDDLASINSEVDNLNIDELAKLDADKLKPVPDDLGKLNDVVKNDVVRKGVYNAKIKNIEDKIPDITNVATNAALVLK